MKYYYLNAAGVLDTISEEHYRKRCNEYIRLYGHAYVLRLPWLGANVWCLLDSENVRLAQGSRPLDYTNLALDV